TSEFDYTDENGQVSNDKTLTTFLSLQNLEIKGLMSRSIAKEGIIPLPDDILLSVAAQEALILKYLIDSRAPMDLLLRSPGNNSLLAVSPVDEQYLIDYFQLEIDVPLDFAANRSARTSEPSLSPANEGISQIQSLIQNQSEVPQTTGGE
ncbi:MAG TPA: hypothetical protein PL105_12790, partial [Caldilineaceae bacterium]|nr:hypothetical protein [Caldilineaceae bacterium]